MRDSGRGPLLGETGSPSPAVVARPAENVLEDPAILIEGFFNEKRIVSDFELRRLRGDRRLLRVTCRRQAADEKDDQQQAVLHHRASTSTKSFNAARVPMVID